MTSTKSPLPRLSTWSRPMLASVRMLVGALETVVCVMFRTVVPTEALSRDHLYVAGPGMLGLWISTRYS